jgi:pyruvate/2-oxoglutarate dehydrogenase complex dihydrolipoamide dehydrogenase (E3) component
MVVGEITQHTDLLVIGAGPGGYAAAFKAADLGLDVTLVDTREQPGGVCLFAGCIPSKALLFLSELIFDSARAKTMGITFDRPAIDIKGIRSWQEQTIARLAKGLTDLCKKRDIQWLQARAVFEGPDTVRLTGADVAHIKFKNAIIATGSSPILPAGLQIKPGGNIADSSAALQFAELPESLLVIGGGYIGLELGQIYAVGDVTAGPMLAHRAIRQGKVAAEVITGLPSAFDNRAIPAVVYTDPQVAWCGLSEEEATRQHIEVKITRFPWSASGRAATMGAPDGLTKLILEADTGRLLGAGLVGRNAETLVAENVLAIEMGALAEDIALSIHPHPTLSETEAEAAEIFFGRATHFTDR